MDKEAKVKVGVEGADEAASAANKVGSAWKQAGGSVASGFKTAGQAVGREIQQIGSDVLRTVTVMRTLSMGEAIRSAHTYREAVTRFGVAAGESVGKAKRSFDEVSKATLIGSEELQRWSQRIGRSTYDLQGARASAKGLADEAYATGKSFDEMGEFGTTLNQSLNVTTNMERALGKIRAQADMLGTVGGVSAFQDQIKSAVGGMVEFSNVTEEGRDRLTAIMGTLGKGLRPGMAGEAMSKGVQFATGKAGMMNLAGGIDIYNEEGGVDTEKLQQGMGFLQKWYKKALPNKKERMIALRNEMGPVAAAAFEKGDFGAEAIAKLMNVPPSGGAADKAKEFKDSKAGQAIGHELEAGRNMGEAADKMNEAADKWTAAFAKSPLLGQVAGVGVQAVGGALVKGGVGAVMGKIGGLLGLGTGAAGAAGAGGAAAAGAAGAGAAGAGAAGAGVAGAGAAGAAAAGVAVAAAGVLAAAAVGVAIGTAIDKFVTEPIERATSGGRQKKKAAALAADPKHQAELRKIEEAVKRDAEEKNKKIRARVAMEKKGAGAGPAPEPPKDASKDRLDQMGAKLLQMLLSGQVRVQVVPATTAPPAPDAGGN